MFSSKIERKRLTVIVVIQRLSTAQLVKLGSILTLLFTHEKWSIA
jgi:hypothetical protein